MKSIVKKIISLATAVLMLGPIALSIGVKSVRAEDEIVLTVFSVEDYIHEAEDDSELGVLDMFKEQTGITVDYQTFATNEDMYNELIKDPYAVDLICPSEYMIMKMMTEDLIRPFETPKNFLENGSPYIKEVFKGLEIETANGKIPLMSSDEKTCYAVGYMWGTLGLIYNTQTVDAKDLTSWTDIWTKFTKKVTIKDSIRDSYFMALAYVYQDELLQAKAEFEQGVLGEKEYNDKISAIFNRTDADSVYKAGEALLGLKNNLYGFEVDSGKNDMLTGKIDVNVAWSGDAVYSIDEALFDEEGNKKPNAMYLGYAVPEEGANVWFDGYVMTKNADYDNAIKFLDFIASPEIAVLNMDYTGYTSCIGGEEVLEYVKESYHSEDGVKEYDLSYFFDPTHTGDDYKINVEEDYVLLFEAQYPTKEIITRCAVMQNFSGEDLERVNEMWKKVKLITLSKTAIITILSITAFIVLCYFAYKFREPIGEFLSRKLPRSKKKKKYNIIKIERI